MSAFRALTVALRSARFVRPVALARAVPLRTFATPAAGNVQVRFIESY